MRLPEQLVSERLLIRRPRQEDEGFVYDYFSDIEVVRFLSFKPLTSPKQAAALLNRWLEAWREGRGAFSETHRSYLYILQDSSARQLGSLGVFASHYGYELSYALAREAWGHGYMPEAVRAVADWLLSHGAWRVFATCHVENSGSQRTLEKAGFERECRMRRYFTFPNLGPEPADGYQYAKVR